MSLPTLDLVSVSIWNFVLHVFTAAPLVSSSEQRKEVELLVSEEFMALFWK